MQLKMSTIDIESEDTLALTTEVIHSQGTSSDKVLNDSESDTSSDSEDKDKDKQQTVQLNVDAVKLFLKSSNAFARFKKEFEDFVNSFESEAMWMKTLWNHRKCVHFEHSSSVPQLTKVNKLKLTAGERLRMSILWWLLRQPRKHLLSSKVCIIWICVDYR